MTLARLGRTIELVSGPAPLGSRLLRRLLFLGLVPLVAGCGSSGGSSTSPNAPTIANLRVGYVPSSPVKGQPLQVFFFVDVVDPDGDWVGGVCRFLSGNLDLPIEAAGLAANATSGTAQCVLSETFSNTPITVDIVVVDRAGHQSNDLAGVVNLEGPAHR